MRNPRNPYDQQIQPPFPKNYVANEDEAESIEDNIHHFCGLDSEIYLTKEEHSMFAQEDDNNDFEEEYNSVEENICMLQMMSKERSN